MKISKIEIENFKAFRKVEIPLNPHFNIIIGENNIGKSTLFEAIHLWMLGYKRLIKANGKSFYGSGTPRYLSFEKLYFLRLSSIDDAFNGSAKTVSITMHIAMDESTYSLKIKFEKPSSMDFYLRVKYEGDDFQRLSGQLGAKGLTLANAIFIFHTRPVFNTIKNEPFYNNAQLTKKISLGKSYDVIRNKILKGDPSDRRFLKLQDRVSNVFHKDIKIRFKNKSLQDEEYVRITVEIENDKELDISLVGSGVLQVIDIFSTLEFINKKEPCLNLLLIDEPDSHLHTNMQSALIDELRTDTKNQHFIITHNERLISKAQEGELLYINRIGLEAGKIEPTSTKHYSAVSAELASQLYSLDELTQTKIIVVTEGKTDKKILEIAWEKLYPGVLCPFAFFCSGIQIDEHHRTGNADSVRRTIQFLSTFFTDLKIVGLFDNDREGYCQYKSLSPEIFVSHSIDQDHRKHLSRSIYGVVLSVPDFRRVFVNQTSVTQRYFVIEHYFSDEILEANGLKGEPILDGVEIFEIIGNKDSFADRASNLDSDAFQHFSLLFDNILQLFAEGND